MDPFTCATAHELLSARLDGELDAAEGAVLDTHLAVCRSCAEHAARARALQFDLRTRPVEMTPDLVPAVMARAQAIGIGAAAAHRQLWVRLSLAWVAIVLGAPSAIALVVGEADGAESHAARHLGSFGLALALGFAFVAWRPRRAAGLLPFTAAFVVLTVGSTVLDLAQGRQTALPETAHLAEIVGLALLWVLSGTPGWRGARADRSAQLARR